MANEIFMKKINVDFKADVLPHLIAVILFLVITLIFFRPVFFEGKTLSQHDILQWEGGAKELLDYRKKTGEEGLWTNSMFGGMPGYLVNTTFSGNLLIHIEKLFTVFLPHPTRIMFASLLSCYILLLAFGVRPYLAMAGALIYGLSSYNTIGFYAGHNARIAAVAYMPLVVAGVHLAFQNRYLWGFSLTALGLGFHLRVNHYQITYYLLLIVVIYGLIRLIFAIKEKEVNVFAKKVGLLSVAALIAVGCNFGRMWTITEYSGYSTRGKSELIQKENPEQNQGGLEKDYAFQYSNSIMEPLVLFVPNFMGGSSQQALEKDSNLGRALKANGAAPAQVSQQLKSIPTYWGKQPNTAPYYVGAIAVFLFILGLFLVDRPLKIWLVTCCVLGIILSWGDNFAALNYLIFDYLPGYNKFRSVTFTIILSIFSIILLGFLGLEKLLQAGLNKKTQKYLLLGVAITGGITLSMVFYSWIGSFRGAVDEQLGAPLWFIDALRKDRAALLRTDALRSLFFIVGSTSLIYFYFKNKLSKIYFATLFMLLTVLDSGLVSSRFLNADKFKKSPERSFFQETPADKLIKNDDAQNFRGFELGGDPFSNARTSYFHQSLGGYHGAKMRRYQDLIEKGIGPEINAWIGDLQKSGGTDMDKYGVLNMLNTKYIMVGPAENAVVPNPDHNGNAWLVSKVIKVNSPDEEIEKLRSLDTKNEAVIDASKFPVASESFNDQGTVTLTDYQPNALTYEASLGGSSLVVFSEIYYPKGWKAAIDGEEAKILRVNYVLRALEVPQGEHTVQFTFEPKSYYLGNTISLIFSIILLLSLGTGLVLSLKQMRQPAAKEVAAD